MVVLCTVGRSVSVVVTENDKVPINCTAIRDAVAARCDKQFPVATTIMRVLANCERIEKFKLFSEYC